MEKRLLARRSDEDKAYDHTACYVAGWINQEQQQIIEYLKAENGINAVVSKFKGRSYDGWCFYTGLRENVDSTGVIRLDGK